MQQPHQHVERVRQHPLSRLPLFGHREPSLSHLQVKTAELVPSEVVQRPGRVSKSIMFECIGRLLGHRRQPRKQPAVFEK